MTNPKPARVTTAGLAFALVGALAACAPGGSDDAESPPVEPAPTASETSAEPSAEPAEPEEPTQEPTGEWGRLDALWSIEDNTIPPLYEHDEAFGFVADPESPQAWRGNIPLPHSQSDVALATVFMGAPNTDVASFILVGLDLGSGEHLWSYDIAYGAACAGAPGSDLLGCAGERIDFEAEQPYGDHPFTVHDVATGEVVAETLLSAPGLRAAATSDAFYAVGYYGSELVLTRLSPGGEVVWETRVAADPGEDSAATLDLVGGGLVQLSDGAGTLFYFDTESGSPAAAPENFSALVHSAAGPLTLTSAVPESSAEPTTWTATDAAGTELWQVDLSGAPQASTTEWLGREYLVFSGLGEVSAVEIDGTVAATWPGDIALQTVAGAAVDVRDGEVIGYDLLTGEVAWTIPVTAPVFLSQHGFFEGAHTEDYYGTSATLTYYAPIYE